MAYPDDEDGAIPTQSNAAQDMDSDIEAAGIGDAAPQQGDGAIPAPDNSGEPPVPNGQTPTSGLLADAQNSNLNQGVKKIVSYLMGAGAAPQQALTEAADQVGDETHSPSDKNLLAVHQAFEGGGPAAAWAMVQANRQAYNAKQNFARAALNGVDGKAGDVAAAADAATKASAHLLDGSSATFHPHQGGVTATVKDPDGKEDHIPLSLPAFNAWLDAGNTSQFDKVIAAGGIARVLRTINAKATPPEGDPNVPTVDDQPNPARAAGHAIARDVTDADQAPLPGQFDDKGHYLGEVAPDKTNYGDELEARSKKIYPGAGQEPERQQWMAAQENTEEERTNKLGIADAGNKAKVRVATIQGGAKVDSAKVGGDSRVAAQGLRSKSAEDVEASRSADRHAKLAAAAQMNLDKLAASAKTADARNRVRMATADLTNPNHVLMTDADVNKLFTKYGLPPMGAPGLAPASGNAAPVQAPPAAQPAPAAPAQQQGSNAGKKFFNGQWYTRQEYQQAFGK